MKIGLELSKFIIHVHVHRNSICTIYNKGKHIIQYNQCMYIGISKIIPDDSKRWTICGLNGFLIALFHTKISKSNPFSPVKLSGICNS